MFNFPISVALSNSLRYEFSCSISYSSFSSCTPLYPRFHATFLPPLIFSQTRHTWSSDGCSIARADARSLTCACTHLTAFNIRAVVTPPIRPIAAADAVNLFNWRNLLDHPIPALVVASMLVIWMIASIVLACLERVQGSSSAKAYRRDDLEGENDGDDANVSKGQRSGGGGCCDRDSFNFYLSTQSLSSVLRRVAGRMAMGRALISQISHQTE